MKRLLAFFLILLLFACRQEATMVAEISGTGIALEELTISDIRQAYEQGTYTIEELVQAYLTRIEQIDQAGPALNAMLTLNPDALAIARALDQERRAGSARGPLHGIPVVLKDNIDTHDGMPTTAGARALKDSYPLQDSWVARQLRASGAVILGKANLSEWANFHSSFSSSGWSGLGGQTKNPYDLSRNPCGSSSGSAVAVSANLCVIAIGTETNGSIVCPANNNGIVGIKPTVGLISRSGIVPISHTQDTPGPMARSVRDAAICLGALTGVDSTDANSLLSQGHFQRDYTPFLTADGLKGKTLGLYTQPLGRHAQVDSLMRQTVRFLEAQGARVIEIDRIAEANINRPAFQVLLHEFKTGLNAYFARLGPAAPVKSLKELVATTFQDSLEMQYFDHALLKQAQETEGVAAKAYQQALATAAEESRANGIDRVMDEHGLDAFIAPTGGPAWKTDLINGDNFGLSSSSPAAIAGYPNISLPMGYIQGLPVGMSIFGRAWSEPVLLEIAYAFEQARPVRRAPRFLPSIP